MSSGSIQLDRREALIVVNPAAFNAPRARRRGEVDSLMDSLGWKVRWEETREPGQAIGIAARAAEEGLPLVVACGGDGTVNEVANGLAGSETTLGAIPAGTSNLWAREVGLNHKAIEAMRLMVTGDWRRVDMGVTGGRYFLMLAGFGIDASITQHIWPGLKKRVGAAAYGLAAIRELLRWKSTPAIIRFDGYERRVDFLMALVGNTRLYAGLTKIASRAVVNDGRLDVCVYEGDGRRDIILHTIRTVAQLHRRSDKVLYRRVSNLEFHWDTHMPVQLDGDPLPAHPTEVSVVPRSLRVAVPAGFSSPLFMPEASVAKASELTLHRPQTA